jgi:sugar phosphate isomerase/epimerase
MACYRPLIAARASRWFKIGACEWSLGKPGPSCFAVAREIGVDGVQVDLGRPYNDMLLLKPEVRKAYREAARQAGLEVASLAISRTSEIPLQSDPRAAGWLAQSLDVCREMGLRIVMPAFFVQGLLDLSRTRDIDHLVDVFHGLTPQFEKERVIIGLENYLSAEENMRLLERIGSPAVKVYYDVGNSTDKGRDVAREIRLLRDLICEFHFKDGEFMLGQGRIDFHKVRAAIDDIGYSGWIQLEAAHPHGLIEDYRDDHKYLRNLFPERG